MVVAVVGSIGRIIGRVVPAVRDRVRDIRRTADERVIIISAVESPEIIVLPREAGRRPVGAGIVIREAVLRAPAVVVAAVVRVVVAVVLLPASAGVRGVVPLRRGSGVSRLVFVCGNLRITPGKQEEAEQACENQNDGGFHDVTPEVLWKDAATRVPKGVPRTE